MEQLILRGCLVKFYKIYLNGYSTKRVVSVIGSRGLQIPSIYFETPAAKITFNTSHEILTCFVKDTQRSDIKGNSKNRSDIFKISLFRCFMLMLDLDRTKHFNCHTKAESFCSFLDLENIHIDYAAIVTNSDANVFKTCDAKIYGLPATVLQTAAMTSKLSDLLKLECYQLKFGMLERNLQSSFEIKVGGFARSVICGRFKFEEHILRIRKTVRVFTDIVILNEKPEVFCLNNSPVEDIFGDGRLRNLTYNRNLKTYTAIKERTGNLFC